MNSEKKLKLIISSLNDKDLIKFFQQYVSYFSTPFNKSIRQISFNCYESVCEFRTKVVNGYGKNSSQAFINGVRNLIDLLLEDDKNQLAMRECLKKLNQNNQSKKKLLATEKTFKTTVETNKSEKMPLTMSSNINFSKQVEKEKTIKQEIFQYLNLENLKISNPNPTHKIKTHQKYLNNSAIDQQQEQLKAVLAKIKEVQNQIQKANLDNQKLKNKLNSIYQREKENKPIQLEKQPIKQSVQNQEQIKCNNLMNYSSQNSHHQASEKVIKQRSISVDPGQKYYAPQNPSSQQKKVKIPKLNLQLLPNYHGKSNKSLNQSLLQVYQKSHK